MGRHKLMEDDELLAKVREIVVKEGIGVSSRRIAERVGISSSVLFQRFGSKEDLVFAAMTPPAPDLDPLLKEGVRPRHARAHLEQIAAGLLDYFRKLVRVLAPLASHPSFDFAEFTKRHPSSPLEKLTAELAAALEEKRRRGEIECPDVGPLVLNLIAIAYSLAMLELMGVHGGEFSQVAVRRLVHLLWLGVAPANQRKPRSQRR
jgi:AcrR family transcriptional regulator